MKLTKVILKCLKSVIFLSLLRLMLNEKKKVPLKIYGLESGWGGGCKKIFAGGGGVIFDRGLEILQKRGLHKKGEDKSRGGL